MKAAEAALAQASQALRDAELYAPQSGVIRERIVEPGDFVTPQTPVLTLALTDPVWVRTSLPETRLGQVKPGARAEIRTDSFPEKQYDGWVGYISPTAEFTPKNVETPELRTRLVYQMRVYACNPENELRLGMQEGTLGNVFVIDALPQGLAFESIAAINGDASEPYSAVAPFVHADLTAADIVVAGNPVTGPTTATITLGTIVNEADGNAANDFFIITYRARVLNLVHPQVNNIGLTNTVAMGYDTATGLVSGYAVTTMMSGPACVTRTVPKPSGPGAQAGAPATVSCSSAPYACA